MKTLQKILLILVIASCTMIVVPQNVSNALDVAEKVGNVTAADDDSGVSDSLTKVVSKILGFIQIASGLLSIVMIAWTGFRYIIETPEMKSELKKNLIPIVVGFLLVFMASTIAKFVIGMFENN